MDARVLFMAGEIGTMLAKEHGRVSAIDGHVMLTQDGRDGLWENGPGAIPPGAGEAVADAIVSVVAEILQAWLDAGSEREVTDEQIGECITDHVLGWVWDEQFEMEGELPDSSIGS